MLVRCRPRAGTLQMMVVVFIGSLLAIRRHRRGTVAVPGVVVPAQALPDTVHLAVAVPDVPATPSPPPVPKIKTELCAKRSHPATRWTVDVRSANIQSLAKEGLPSGVACVVSQHR